MYVRGIRGATTVENNDEQEILESTYQLLQEMVRQNEIKAKDICSVLITTTRDLDAAFPAKAVRSMPGWQFVPVMCAQEIPVPGSLPKCIRMLILTNTDKNQEEIVHVYLNKAKSLRPDLLER